VFIPKTTFDAVACLAVLAEAWRHVAKAPGGYGVSLDLDVLEPMLAPGVSVPEG
jgi:arginase